LSKGCAEYGYASLQSWQNKKLIGEMIVLCVAGKACEQHYSDYHFRSNRFPDGHITISLFLSFSASVALSASPVPGDLDLSFGSAGKVTTAIGTSSDKAYSVAIQNDGKILVAGSVLSGTTVTSFALARYNADGTLDTSFNSTGMAITAFPGGYSGAQSLAVQSDGKILVAGYARARDYSRLPEIAYNEDFALARYNVDGSLDTTFNGTGMVTTSLGVEDDRGGVCLRRTMEKSLLVVTRKQVLGLH